MCALARTLQKSTKKHPNGLFERVVQQIALGTLFFKLISVKMIPEGSPERSERRLGTLLGALGALLGRSWAALGRSWALLGRSWGALGPLLGALGDDFCVNVRSSRIFHGFLIDFWSILDYFLRDFKGFCRQSVVRLHVFLRRGHIVKTLKNHCKKINVFEGCAYLA